MMPIEPRLDVSILSARLLRLAKLDTTVFDEVRLDPAATLPSIAVVILSTAIAGIGGWMWWIVKGYGDSGKLFMHSVIIGTFLSFALWIVWLLIAYVILTQVFNEDADWQQMLRTMGMAAVPLTLSVAMFIPGIDFGIGLASIVLFFGLTTIAIQATTPANPARVLVANLAGFTIWSIVLGLLVTDSNFFAPGIFLFGAPAEALAKIADAFSNFSL